MKVGDYVRMSWGISKVSNVYQRTDGNMVFDTINGYQNYFTELIKSSPNIIDLIEIGDYVNGHLVKNRRASCNENLGGHPKQVDIGENEDYIWISESKIKSIVTKEQFKNIEYEVE